MEESNTIEELRRQLSDLKQELSALQSSYRSDIAQREQAEAKLRDEQAFTGKLLECLPGIFYLYTYPELRLVKWNKNHETLLGFTAEEIHNRYIMDWHIPEAVPLVQQAVDLVMEKGENVLESPLLNKNGEYIPFMMTGVRFDASGQQYLIGFGIDIRTQKKMENAVHESESLFRMLAENATDMIARHDKTGIVTYVTPSCKKLLGYDPEELIGHSVFEHIHPDDMPKILALRNAMTGQNEIKISTSRHRRKDGEYIWFETISKAIVDKNGGVIEIHASSRDISERIRRENEARESDVLFRTVVTNMSAIVFVLDRNGIFTLSEGAGLAKLGLSPGQVVGLSVFEMYRDYPDIVESMHQALRGNIQQNEVSIAGIVFDIIFSPIIGTDGTVSSVIGLANDITQRRQSEQKLADNQKQLSMLFSSMTEMVAIHEVVFDEQGVPVNYRITDCNDAYTRITGICKEDAKGRLATDVYHTDIPPFLTEFTNIGINGGVFEYTTYFAPMDKHFMISVVSPDKNKFATITTDVTTIQQVQESISEKNKELENYLYVASHDLRSPLVNIQGFGQRLQKQIDAIGATLSQCSADEECHRSMKQILNDDIPQTLSFVFSNVAKMDNLINGLLQISRTGRIKMNIAKVDMNALFASILAANNFQIAEFSAKVEIEDLTECYGDSNQLNQLFSNIITNAVKYHDPARQLVISISSRIQYNKVIYRIADTGIGIDQRHLKRIWDVFFRVDSASAVTGEGLGLSIAKRIADKHKGRIWADSEIGKGTVFCVELQKNIFTE